VDAEQLAEKLRQAYGGPMSEGEVEVLRDAQAFIEFAVRNGLSFALVWNVLGHDANGFARHGLDLSEARSCGFSPKVGGYSKLNPEAVGQPDEPSE